MKCKTHLLGISLLIFLVTAILFMIMDVFDLPRKKSCGREPSSNTSGKMKLYTREKKKTQHLYFLKTHKCGSTTITCLLQRFGYLNNLTFVLPTDINSGGVYIDKKQGYLPAPKGEKYEILVHHSRYNRRILQKILPVDTKYIGLVREPLARFVSAFIYFRYKLELEYVVRIPGKDINAVISWYLNNTASFTRKIGLCYRYFDNLMAYDFGFPTKDRKNADDRKIAEFLKGLDAEFDLVIVLEYLDESLILMKRMMNWSMKDIIYIKQMNKAVINKEDVLSSLTVEDKQKHRKHEFLDFAIYNYFFIKLLRKISNEGFSFHKELEDYRAARDEVTRFCDEQSLGEELLYKTKYFKEEIKINSTDCYLMNLDGFRLRTMIRQSKQYMINKSKQRSD